MFCPHCLSTTVVGGRRATDDRRVYALVRCTDCGTVFDAYTQFGAPDAPAFRQSFDIDRFGRVA